MSTRSSQCSLGQREHSRGRCQRDAEAKRRKYVGCNTVCVPWGCKSVAGRCVVRVCVLWGVCGVCAHSCTLSWWLLRCRLYLEWDGPVSRVEVRVAARGFLREGEAGPEQSGLSELRSRAGSPQRLDPPGKEALEPRPPGAGLGLRELSGAPRPGEA